MLDFHAVEEQALVISSRVPTAVLLAVLDQLMFYERHSRPRCNAPQCPGETEGKMVPGAIPKQNHWGDCPLSVPRTKTSYRAFVFQAAVDSTERSNRPRQDLH